LSAAPAGEPSAAAAGSARSERAGPGGPAWLSGAADGRLAAGVFAALVLACFAALLITQRLKHTPTPVEDFKRTRTFTPGASGAGGEEHIAFKLTKADRVTVTVESSSGEEVATLVSALPVGRYRIVSLRWNGRRGVAHGYRVIRKADGYTTIAPHNSGPLAAPGEYQVRVALLDQKRSVPSPLTFRLVGR
jgi:hypothetical protein